MSDLEALKKKIKEALSHAGAPAEFMVHVDNAFAEEETPKKMSAQEPVLDEEEDEEPEIEPIPDEEGEDDPPPKKTVRKAKRRY